MYKYFVAYNHFTNDSFGTGNIILETSTKITYYADINNLQSWINSAQKWIEKNYNLKGVVIINFIQIIQEY